MAEAGPVVTGIAVVEVDLGRGVRAGFTTRGAADVGPAGDGWNLGLGVGDDPAAVLRRRRRVEDWAGGPVAWATQVHGTAVLDVPGSAGGVHPGAAPWAGGAGSSLGEADALVAGRGAGVAVVVADCVPVLLADSRAGVVAAVHAGRRGLAAGVVQAAVGRMAARGASRGDVRAAVGPAICGRCYEVPAELRASVAAVVPGVASRTSWGTPALDLPAGVAAALRAAGVRDVQVMDLCTRTDERFFSHRRSTATAEREGRCAGVVRSDTPRAGVSDDGGTAAGR